MSQLKAHGKPLDHFILPLLGFSLVATAAAVMLRKRILAAGGNMFELSEQTANRLATVVGVVLGVMVTLTSVGAGAIGVAALMLLYPKLRGAEIVGSDLAHAIPLVTVAGLGHLQLGNIDYRLLVGLLLGSIPGIYIGSTVSSRLPEVMMRRILAGVLLGHGHQLHRWRLRSLMDLAEKTSELISYLKQIEATQSPTAFACSFGAEDMVLLDAIAQMPRQIEVFTLDTGRLPEETHALLETVRDNYPIAIRTYFPDAAAVEDMGRAKWPERFL